MQEVVRDCCGLGLVPHTPRHPQNFTLTCDPKVTVLRQQGLGEELGEVLIGYHGNSVGQKLIKGYIPKQMGQGTWTSCLSR